MAKTLKKDQLSYLRRYAKSKTLDELVERLGLPEPVIVEALAENDLQSKDGRGHEPGYVDPLLEVFEKGLQAFHKGQWKAASKSFSQIVEESDQLDFQARARIYLEAAEARTNEDVPAEEEVDDHFLEAVVAKNAGDLETAMALCSRGGRRSKDERFAYLAASISALGGDTDQALEQLRLAIELNAKNRVHAYHDPDFDRLRGESRFAELFETV